MKIRNGFVSNSSSSSFIVVYKDLKTSDIDYITENMKVPEHLKGKVELLTNKCLSDGYDVVDVTDEILKCILENADNLIDWYTTSIYDIIEVIKKVEFDFVITQDLVGCKIASYEEDYHITGNNLKRFVERYIKGYDL